jgi:hypothetical protein
MNKNDSDIYSNYGENPDLSTPLFYDLLKYVCSKRNSIRREEIIEEIYNIHTEHNGIYYDKSINGDENKSKNYIMGKFKYIIKKFTTNNTIIPLSKGIYSWNKNKDSNENIEIVDNKEEIENTNDVIEPIVLDNKFKKNIDRGVDVYCKNSDWKKNYILHKEIEVKIGFSVKNMNDRINNQCKSFGEIPITLVKIYSENAKLLETYLHSIMKLKNKHINTGNGAKEWFTISIQELVTILNVSNTLFNIDYMVDEVYLQLL